nr:MAG TPA: hypothetical protein [Caudoviricetes sp.]
MNFLIILTFILIDITGFSVRCTYNTHYYINDSILILILI